MEKFIVGIDIGSSKVCGSVGIIDKYGNLQIVGITSVACLGIRKAVIIDIESTSEAICNCIRKLENMVDVEINKASISLPASIYDLVYNGEIKETDLFKSFSRANIKIEELIFQPIGAAEVLLEKEDMEIGVALLDIGADTTTVSIFKDGSLCFTEMIPLGGSSITNDISMVLKIPIEEAEEIKIKHANVIKVTADKEKLIRLSNNIGSEIKYSVLCEIIEARVEEILSFVYKSLQKSGFYNEISSLFLSGGGISLINGISEFSKEIIGKDVKVVSPKYVGASSPLYSNCVGILKYILNKTKYTNEEESLKKPIEDKLIYDSNKSEKDNPGILVKIKKFLGDFF